MKTSIIVKVIALSLCLYPGLAFAIDCAKPETQIDIDQCANSELEAETAAINSVYQRYMAGLDASEKKLLKKVQLAWIAYRDLACEFEASPLEGGSMHSHALAQCLIKQSKVRRQQLEALLRCDEGTTPGANCRR